MTRVGLLGGAAVLTLAGTGVADTSAETTNDELRARVAELEARLAQVESQNGGDWLTERRAEEIRGLVQDVLADADTRSSLLAQGMTAGYDDGAVISSADGKWLLRTNLLMQQRFIADFQDNAPTDDDRWGFENTRTKFILSGNVVNPDWFYRVDINVARNAVFQGTVDGATFDADRSDVLNAYLGYDYGNGFHVKMGTMKQPFLREELVDAQYQLAVERSLINYLFSPGYSEGLAIKYMGDQFAVSAMYSNGIQRNTALTALIGLAGLPSVASGEQGLAIDRDTDFAFAVRGELLAMGTWDQFMDFTSPAGEESGLLVGGGIYYEESEDQGGQPDIELVSLTADVSAELGGWNAFGALVYSSIDAGFGQDLDQLGIVLQGGAYFGDTWEGFLRYEWADLDSDIFEDVNILTLGVNKYFAQHNAKWTTDIGVAFDPVLFTGTLPTGENVELNSPITGYRGDTAGEDGQVVIRTQLQILF